MLTRWQSYSYRKMFPAVSHTEFLAMSAHDVEWDLKLAALEGELRGR